MYIFDTSYDPKPKITKWDSIQMKIELNIFIAFPNLFEISCSCIQKYHHAADEIMSPLLKKLSPISILL